MQELPFDFVLNSPGTATKAMRNAGCSTFAAACRFVAQLPYRRNQDKSNIICAVEEGCGTCSTKHALLKKIAEEHQQDTIHLVIGIYFLNRKNTPKVQSVLQSYNLQGFPEAHCYLTYESSIYDFTFPKTNMDFADDLLEEYIVHADEVAKKKLGIHKQYLRKWLIQQELPFTHDAIWGIREACIAALSR